MVCWFHSCLLLISLTQMLGALCLTGNKALCCPNPSPYQNCAWRGTAPFCNGKCPNGQVMLYSDAAGDGSWCVTGKKVYCVRAAYEFPREIVIFTVLILSPQCDPPSECCIIIVP